MCSSICFGRLKCFHFGHEGFTWMKSKLLEWMMYRSRQLCIGLKWFIKKREETTCEFTTSGLSVVSSFPTTSWSQEWHLSIKRTKPERRTHSPLSPQQPL